MFRIKRLAFDPAVAKGPIRPLESLGLFRERRKGIAFPGPIARDMSAQIAWAQTLHRKDDHAGLLVVKARRQRLIEEGPDLESAFTAAPVAGLCRFCAEASRCFAQFELNDLTRLVARQAGYQLKPLRHLMP